VGAVLGVTSVQLRYGAVKQWQLDILKQYVADILFAVTLAVAATLWRKRDEVAYALGWLIGRIAALISRPTCRRIAQAAMATMVATLILVFSQKAPAGLAHNTDPVATCGEGCAPWPYSGNP
jgi:hypothetical protein